MRKKITLFLLLYLLIAITRGAVLAEDYDDLFQAIEEKAQSKVISLLDSVYYINYKSDKGITPLMAAVLNNDMSMVEVLLDYNPLLGVQDWKGKTALHYAIDQDAMDMFTLLLDKYWAMDSNYSWYNKNLLIYSVVANKMDYVKALVERGADVNVRDHSSKKTALMYASEEGCTEMVEYLLEMGADPSIGARDEFRETKSTPLMYAVAEEHHELARTIFDYGIKNNRKDSKAAEAMLIAAEKGNFELVKYLVDKGVDPKYKRKSNLVLNALIADHIELLNFVLEAGADPKATNFMGQGAVELVKSPAAMEVMKKYGIVFDQQAKEKLLITAILEDRKDLFIQMASEITDYNYGQNYVTPILAASTSKDDFYLEYLLENGAQADFSVDQVTSLMGAAGNRDAKKIQLLLKAGVDLQATDEDGRNALHFALKYTKVEVSFNSKSMGYKEEMIEQNIIDLLSNKDSINQRNEDRQTPLLIAAEKKAWDIVEYLVELGADYQSDAYQLLVKAATNGDVDVLRRLLKLGVDPTVESNGRNPIAYSANREILAELEQYVDVEKYLESTLIAASRRNHVEVYAYLLDKYSDEITKEWILDDLLQAEDTGNYAIIQTILETGMLDQSELNKWLGKAIYSVIFRPNFAYLKSVATFIKFGADVDVKGDNGYTALMVASYVGHFTMVKQLVEAGADVNVLNGHGDSALSMAIRRNNYAVIDYLLQNGAVANITPKKLNNLYQSYDLEILSRLVEKGLNPDSKDDQNKPLLAYAIERGSAPLFDLLIQHGADTSIKYRGSNLLEFARKYGRNEIAKRVESQF